MDEGEFFRFVPLSEEDVDEFMRTNSIIVTRNVRGTLLERGEDFTFTRSAPFSDGQGNTEYRTEKVTPWMASSAAIYGFKEAFVETDEGSILLKRQGIESEWKWKSPLFMPKNAVKLFGMCTNLSVHDMGSWIEIYVTYTMVTPEFLFKNKPLSALDYMIQDINDRVFGSFFNPFVRWEILGAMLVIFADDGESAHSFHLSQAKSVGEIKVMPDSGFPHL